MQLTIFTPTYNREKYLSKLYNSLLQQKNKLFQWLIVDDGSTDNTRNVVLEFMKESKMNITYYKQKNFGKHIAHNEGVKLCETELFFCVDSDDYLYPDAIEKILRIWNSRDRSLRHIGIAALKGYFDRTVSGNKMPSGVRESTLSNLYNSYGKTGETALIYQSKLLKKYLFPYYKNEKFLSEEVVYNQLDSEGNLILLNEIIYGMEYLTDGITRNLIKTWKSSPKGVICLLHSRYHKARLLHGWRKHYLLMRTILVLNAFCFNRNLSILKYSPNTILSILLQLPAVLVSYVKFGERG